MSNNKIAALIPTSTSEAQELARVYAASALLPPDLRNKPADVFVTIMAGLELGLAPMAALRSIHIVKGKPVLSADAMVAVAHASGACEFFRCVESTDSVATYETKRRGSEPVRRSFTIAQAKLAGLAGKGNWATYPAAMLRARCKADLARDVYPDAVAGVLTDDEVTSDMRPIAQQEPAAIEVDAPELLAFLRDEAAEAADHDALRAWAGKVRSHHRDGRISDAARGELLALYTEARARIDGAVIEPEVVEEGER